MGSEIRKGKEASNTSEIEQVTAVGLTVNPPALDMEEYTSKLFQLKDLALHHFLSGMDEGCSSKLEFLKNGLF